jgi:hypothetical protein
METLLARLDDPAIEGGLFHDTGILPAQFYPGHRDVAPTEPIKKLMTAILVDAVQCYRAGRRQTVKGTEALEANIWRKQLRDSDTQASEGGRPKMIRRPAIRTLKVKGEARRSQRSSKLRSAENQSLD